MDKKGIKARMWMYLYIIAGIYVFFCLVIFLFQKNIVFHPYKTGEYAQTPESIGLVFDEFMLESSGGKIASWFIPAEKPLATVLFCHGNAGNISHRLALIERFNSLNLNVFIFDYSGYGKSEGKASEETFYADSEAAWNFLKNEKNISSEKIIIAGRSLGGPLAAKLAEKYNPGALILESTFISAPDLAADKFPFFPARILCSYGFETLKYVKNVKSPKLFIHSRDDEIIPFYHGIKLYREASEPKGFVELSGDHNNCYSLSLNYLDELIAFTDKYFSSDETKQKINAEK